MRNDSNNFFTFYSSIMLFCVPANEKHKGIQKIFCIVVAEINVSTGTPSGGIFWMFKIDKDITGAWDEQNVAMRRQVEIPHVLPE